MYLFCAVAKASLAKRNGVNCWWTSREQSWPLSDVCRTFTIRVCTFATYVCSKIGV